MRVSTEAQSEHGHGLDVQEQALRAWAKVHGHKLVDVLREEGVSGTKDLLDRPALAEGLHALRQRRAQGLVVYRLDRLARDLILQEQLLAEVKRLGAQVFSTMAGEAAYLQDDPDDPSRRLIRQILGAVSEYERSVVVMRLRSGRRRKKELGGYAAGAPPFGYEAVGKALSVCAREQKVLERIAILRADGRSLREICVVLEEEGLPPKRGGRWHPETLRRAIGRSSDPSIARSVGSTRTPASARPIGRSPRRASAGSLRSDRPIGSEGQIDSIVRSDREIDSVVRSDPLIRSGDQIDGVRR